MLVSQRWHTEDHFRLVASHSAMPSLCPLPSAVSTGGEAILLPWEVSLRKRGFALVLVTAGFGLKNRILVPKLLSWHLGIPGARHRNPLSSPARDWGWDGGCKCPQSLAVPQEMTHCLCHLRAEPTTDWPGEALRRCCTVLAGVFGWALHYKSLNINVATVKNSNSKSV